MADEPRLLDQVRAAIRVRHYSLRTEQTYIDWIRRFIFFRGTRHPRERPTRRSCPQLSQWSRGKPPGHTPASRGDA